MFIWVMTMSDDFLLKWALVATNKAAMCEMLIRMVVDAFENDSREVLSATIHVAAELSIQTPINEMIEKIDGGDSPYKDEPKTKQYTLDKYIDNQKKEITEEGEE